MAQVRWTPQALDDLEAICLFIARDAPQIAAIFGDRAFRATDRLKRYPLSGRRVPELRRETFREILLYSYRIIYRVQGNEVQVLPVYHGSRILDARKID